MTRARTGRGVLAVGALVALALGGCTEGGMNTSAGSTARLAERAAAGGDHETAAALFRQEFEANPRSTDALVGLGRSYGAMGQHARAEQALLEASSRRPRDPQILLELARVQLGGGKPQSAIANLELAAERAPRDLSIITARGIALDRLSRHAEAQQVYRQGLAIDPTHFAILSNLGLSLGLSGRPQEGIVILRELVGDSAATAQTRGNLALVYGLAGQEREARAALGRDLPPREIDANIAYYRELRGLLAQGRPIGSLQ